MTTVTARPNLLRAGVILLIALIVAAFATVASLSPAHAAARVDVAPTPNADGSTTVTVTGSGFQYLPNAPGGVYVFFGAVSDPSTNAWAPSQGGRSGSTFSYASTSGAQLLVGFAGGSSADAASSTIDANGTWTAQLTIPGARFPGSSGDPHSGQAQTGSEIDCLQVQCGVITIGAHGSVNANNESFTPVGFVTADGSVQSGSAAPSFTDDATVLEIPEADAQETHDATEAAPAEAAPAEPAPTDEGVVAPAEEPEAGSNVSTLIVIGVLGFAVLALIAALVAVAVKRARAKQPAEEAAEASPEDQQTHQTTPEGADAL